MRALGMMSGTSLDGVDIAMIETDGERISAFGPTGYRPYTADERDVLRKALDEAKALTTRDARPGAVAEAERIVTDVHTELVISYLREHGIAADSIDIVGFHGQTVLHRPEQRLTIQIGDGGALARAIRIPVAYDFRAADVAAGGQGAPFVPVYHRALAQSAKREGPIVVVNIGGVSNITYIDGDDTLMACDTGPGNALLDDFMLQRTGNGFDDSGNTAARGIADHAWIEQALAHPFFGKPLPKSLDRDDFAALTLGDVSIPNGAATLTAFTARAIAAVARLLPKRPESWIVVGGGARNRTLMRLLQNALATARAETGDALGWSPDAVEAQAFAYLAVRSLKTLPLSYPQTTGVPHPMPGGIVAHPQSMQVHLS